MSIDPNRLKLSGPTMGSTWHATVETRARPDPDTLTKALQLAVDEVCAQMSPWDPNSAINRLNAHSLNAPLTVPAWTLEVLDTGLRIGAASDGAFEMSVLDAVNEWGFGAAKGQASPSPRPMPRATAALLLDLDASTVTKTRHAALDLCGIAKGFGVDRLADVLRAQGLTSFLVAIDGEVVAGEAPLSGGGWTLGIERPDYLSQRVYQSLSLTGKAIATSGNFRHFRDVGGLRFAHTMDAATGWPTDSDLASVSVVHERCMDADAWATALLVKGSDQGVAFAEDQGLAALFLMLDEGELIEYRTRAFSTL